MESKHREAIVIGETKLCIQCTEILLGHGWKIIYIISDDKVVTDWARNNSISTLSSTQLSTINITKGYYLFSIINPHIIPESILTHKNLLLAINYHDSLLPKYAGLNSTTWAIINKEKYHGVTLHKITPGIDGGEIVAQGTFSIEKDETALSLNLKCSEKLLSLFKKTISKIETKTLKFSQQNLVQRTYYNLKHLPYNYGVINGIKDIATLYKLVKGLTFGYGYENPVSTIKVWLKNQFYIVEKFNQDILNKNNKLSKGTILFDEVKDIYGNKTDLKIRCKDIWKAHALNKNELKYLSDIKTKEKKYKDQILKFFEEHSDAVTKILDYTSEKSNRSIYVKRICASKDTSTITMLALTCLALVRFFKDDFIATMYLEDDKIPQPLRNLIDCRNYIYAHKGILNKSFTDLEQNLTQVLADSYTVTKDFNYRYNISVLTDIAITVGKVASTDNHRVVIKIEDCQLKEIKIQGNNGNKLQIDSIAKAIQTLLASDIQNEVINKDLRYINLLNPKQYQQIVYNWNKTEKNYPGDKTIHQLFEEQVLKTPNNIAVVCGDKKITYAELNRQANQLANYLSDNYRIKPDDLVVLCLDRTELMIIAIFGVLKAGGAYVPIDPSYPNERMGYILNDTRTKIFLTNEIYETRLKQCKYNLEITDVISLDSMFIYGKLNNYKTDNPSTQATNNNLVYAIYTSGTTGNPKGVLLEHYTVANYVTYLIKKANLNEKSVGSKYAAFGFDASVTEIYPILLAGGMLHLIDEQDRLDLAKINNFFNKNGITYAFLPTKMAELFFEIEKTSLKYLIVGGEKLEKFIKRKYQVINAYGPAETTVQPTCFIVDKQYSNIPIGKPINNVKCYVVDNNLNILPCSAVGELLVGGECLARGYLNLPELTLKKFIPNPFRTSEEIISGKNARVYKTGDLVKMLPDGNMEFVGRNDFQVQIRGFRVELNEIENVLLSHPEIKQVVVIAKDTKDKKSNYLVAYYVADGKLGEEELRGYLLSKIPEYMIPSIWIKLDYLPLTINSKVDKSALPEPILTNKLDFIAPRNKLEKMVCEIYAKTLNLPTSDMGITNDFFKMGGDSISSIRLVSQIRQQLKLEVAIKDIFNQRNIEQLVKNVLVNQIPKKENVSKIKQEDSRHANWKYLNKIRKDPNVEDVYFANNLQQGFIYHAIRYGESDSAYISQFIWRYHTLIDESKFKKAWQLVQRKYPSLRLRFAWNEELIQIIEKKQNLDFRYIDLSSLDKKTHFDYQSQLSNIMKKDLQERYDLQKGNLFRIYLIKFSANNYSSVYSCHHIIVDGWSSTLLFNCVHELYLQLLKDKQPRIVKDISYKKAQEYLCKHRCEHQEYWDNYLKQIDGRVNLKPLLKPSALNMEIKNHKKVNQSKEQLLEIKGMKFAKLKKICQANAITINAVIQYVWHKILHIYGTSNTTAVGTVIAGRNIPVDNVENSIGLFINTLPLILKHDNRLEVIEQIKIVQNLINEINDKSNVELASLQSWNERLFDSLLSYENYPAPECTVGTIYGDMWNNFKLDYPLALIVYEKKQALTIILKYAGELFRRDTISSLLNKLLFFIEQFSENPHKKMLCYLTPQEYQNIVIDYNKTEKDCPRDKTIHQLFEDQVLKTPNNIAVVFETERLMYEELNEKSNQLARYLREENRQLTNDEFKPDTLVILYLDRSIEMIVAILAVLKAGGAYVPIEPNYPRERIEYILEDTKSHIVITQQHLRDQLDNVIKQNGKDRESLENKPIKLIVVDNIKTQQELSVLSTNNLDQVNRPTDLAYVIYTSGTTGNPKGVMLEHKGVINTVLSLYNVYDFSKGNKSVAFTSYMFDVSVSEFFIALFRGAELHVLSEAVKKDAVLISDYVKNVGINYIYLPPAMLSVFPRQSYETLQGIIYAGEPCDKETGKYWSTRYHLYNYYGPTETTIYATGKRVIEGDIHLIGVPIFNTQCYVLDKNLLPVPIGIIGELYVGGVGLARGYLNQEKLTLEKFITNPFQTLEEKAKNINCRLYKTGDMVKMLPDGNIEYIGRNDFQIKIRGYRIELGEIENKLLSYPDIKQALVVVKDELHNKSLVAYYVSDRRLDEHEIESYLLRHLPAYMIPEAFVYIQKIPVTIGGKLDRSALPKPEFKNEDRYMPPRNSREELVCDAFAKVLNLQKVGINDDFFRLGGNSISAIKLVSIMQSNFDVKIADIFDCRTPRKLAVSSLFGKNFLQNKLEMVKLAYRAAESNKKHYKREPQMDPNDYLDSAGNVPKKISLKKQICNVLLTGATGYLGCNILNQLLTQTDYKIYLLIRANSHSEAIERINQKYRFYFDRSLNDQLNFRVFIFKSDIEEDSLGLQSSEYHFLTTKIDSVVHAAALVKHYGEYNKFYSANVKATKNLLDFTKLTKQKDFHYISTIWVLDYGAAMRRLKSICTEDDLPIVSEILSNNYSQTKLLGEHQVIKYQNMGLKCNIYRVGNLAFMSENYRAQENINDNAFYNWLKCLFTIKSCAKNITKVEISQTNLTAEAIVKIFDKKCLSNQIYHVFNPCLFDLADIFRNNRVKILPVEMFVDQIEQYIREGSYHDLIVKFLLHQGWLDWDERKSEASMEMEILQNRTEGVLKGLNFSWPPNTYDIIHNYFNILKSLKFTDGIVMKNKPKIFSDLERLMYFIPAPLAWLDLNGNVLGVNDVMLQSTGSKRENVIGKNAHDFYPKHVADVITKNIQSVVKERRTITFEETIVDMKTGKNRYFLTTRAPLLDDDGTIIVGLIETAVEITDRKENEQLRVETELQRTKLQEQLKLRKIIDQAAYDIQSPLAVLLLVSQNCMGLTKDKILDTLKSFAAFIPVSTFWLDADGMFIGANKNAVAAMGAKSADDIIGKKVYDLYPHDMADKILKHNQEVIKDGKTLSQEEIIKDITTGKTKYFTVYKVPLYDNKEDIVVLVGTMVDITTSKQAEALKIEKEKLDVENMMNKKIVQEQDKFRNIVDKVVHDVRSPISSLLMIIKSYAGDIPEEARLALREAATKIGDITDHLLNQYKKDESEVSVLEGEQPQPVMLSLILSQILSEKKHQYKEMLVKFTHDFCPECHFVFIKMDLTSFNRMMSNLINNAVEALDGKEGEVSLRLRYDNVNATIIVEDNGQGMPREVIDKIMANIRITSGKSNGHGIGFAQIKESLERNYGKLEIISKQGEGTQIILAFPLVEAPSWVASEIKLNQGDTVVILDDDSSIHHAWDSRFKKYGQAINLKHFTLGEDAINFITQFLEKDKLFLLCDFELLKQELNGINVIEKAKLKRSILVTSHFTNLTLQDLVVRNNTKILPKPFASEVPIKINAINSETITERKDKKSKESKVNKADTNKRVDLVLIDDDEMLVDSLSQYFERQSKKVDKYLKPLKFLENLLQYSKDTIICMDNDFQSTLNGIELAKKLHEQGYKRLYLFSGKDLKKEEIPEYLTVISKMDTDKLFKLII